MPSNSIAPVRSAPNRSGREEGSAYVLALLVMLLVTILGIGLAAVTQLELEIGGTERTLQRTFYAANSGLSTVTARVLVSADYEARSFSRDDRGALAATQLRHQVDISPILPIRIASCNLCEVNNAGNYGDATYQTVNHAVSSLARRMAGPENAPIPVGRKLLSMMVEFQPWRAPVEALVPVNDPAELEKIKF
jgi:hypothetical protein